jgi:predicted nucleic acid-binding protein
MNGLIEKVFVDTNILLRYLTADDPVQFPRCRDLFRKAQEGDILLATSTLVIAELISTLTSYYKVSKDQVVEKVSIIVASPGVYIPEKDLIAEALLLYGRKNIDYIDAYNAVLIKHLNLKRIFSYDKDFEQIEGIRRLEP